MSNEGSEYIDAYEPTAPKEAGTDYQSLNDMKQMLNVFKQNHKNPKEVNRETGQDYKSETEDKKQERKKKLEEELKDLKVQLDYYKEKKKKSKGSTDHAFTDEDFKSLKTLRERVEELKENEKEDEEYRDYTLNTKGETHNDASKGSDFSQQLLPNKITDDGAIVPLGDQPHAPVSDADCNNYSSPCICHCEKGDAGAKASCLEGC